MLYSLAIGAEVEFTPAEEKTAQIIAVDHDPDPYQLGKNTPVEFITNRFYMLRHARWTVRTKEYHGMSYAKAVKTLAEFVANLEKGKNWQVKNEKKLLPFLKKSPNIDGEISEKEWNSALKFEGEYRIGTTTKDPNGKESEFFIAHNGENFYVAAKFRDETIYSYHDREYDKTPYPLYAGDVFEIFIRPDITLPYYCEVQVNPESELWILRHKNSPFGGWDVLDSFAEFEGIESKIKVENNILTLEVKIPFEFISKYAEIKDFSFLLVRSNRSSKKDHVTTTIYPLLYDVHNIFGYMESGFVGN